MCAGEPVVGRSVCFRGAVGGGRGGRPGGDPGAAAVLLVVGDGRRLGVRVDAAAGDGGADARDAAGAGARWDEQPQRDGLPAGGGVGLRRLGRGGVRRLGVGAGAPGLPGAGNVGAAEGAGPAQPADGADGRGGGAGRVPAQQHVRRGDAGGGGLEQVDDRRRRALQRQPRLPGTGARPPEPARSDGYAAS